MSKLTLIIPVFNEETAIHPFFEHISHVLPQLMIELGDNPQIEIIFVNDGSLDNTRSVLHGLCKAYDFVKVINLSRNFGKEAALSAGFHYATGQAVVPVDVDLQDPPEIIVEMIRKWKAGAHVVNARRIDRSSDTVFKRISAKFFYSLIKRISDQPLHMDVGDFRLFDQQAVKALNQLGENARFNKGLFSWIGFRVDEVEFARPERQHGQTKWNVTRLWSLALDGITSTTTLPLRIWSYLGAGIAFFAFIYAIALVTYTLLTGGDTPGYASTIVAVLTLGGLNLLGLGIIGEYLGRIAMEVRRRPLYIIESTEGM